MKKITLIFGCLLIFLPLVSLWKYAFDYVVLSQYGKGFVWGNILIFLIALLLIYIGIRNPKAPS
ncbi:MAG: hypothetical protein V3V00_14145 [Saprospiraceae bacterium]